VIEAKAEVVDEDAETEVTAKLDDLLVHAGVDFMKKSDAFLRELGWIDEEQTTRNAPLHHKREIVNRWESFKGKVESK